MTALSSAARLATGQFTPFLQAFWGEDERQAVASFLDGGHDRAAPEQLADAVRALGLGDYVLPTSSGRAALQLALKGLALPSDSEVLIPSFSCLAVPVAVAQAGHRPVLCDVDKQLNLSIEGVTSAFGPGVRGVVLPHLAGAWAQDTRQIVSWAKQHGVAVVEDVAQSLGLQVDGRPAGTAGDVAVYSTGLGKPLHGPGGGWLCTSRPEIAERLSQRVLADEPRQRVERRLRDFLARNARGMVRQGTRRVLNELVTRSGATSRTGPPEDTGFAFPVQSVSEVEARVALIQLGRLQEIVRLRQEHARRWRSLLSAGGLESVVTAPVDDNIFVKLWLSFERAGGPEAAVHFRRMLWRFGVETEPLYTPLHRRPGCEQYRHAPTPVTDRLWASVFSVPARPGLGLRDWRRIDAAVRALGPDGA